MLRHIRLLHTHWLFRNWRQKWIRFSLEDYGPRSVFDVPHIKSGPQADQSGTHTRFSTTVLDLCGSKCPSQKQFVDFVLVCKYSKKLSYHTRKSVSEPMRWNLFCSDAHVSPATKLLMILWLLNDEIPKFFGNYKCFQLFTQSEEQLKN